MIPDKPTVFAATALIGCLLAVGLIVAVESVTGGVVTIPWMLNEQVEQKYDCDGFSVILTRWGWLWVNGQTSSLSSEDERFKYFFSPEAAHADALRHPRPSKIRGVLLSRWYTSRQFPLIDLTGPKYRSQVAGEFPQSDWDGDGDVDLADYATAQEWWPRRREWRRR